MFTRCWTLCVLWQVPAILQRALLLSHLLFWMQIAFDRGSIQRSFLDASEEEQVSYGETNWTRPKLLVGASVLLGSKLSLVSSCILKFGYYELDISPSLKTTTVVYV